MEQSAAIAKTTNIKNILKEHSFLIVCFLCFVFSICAIWIKPYFLIAYIATLVICSLFYDVNKMAVLCLFSIFGLQSLHVFGLMQFVLCFTIISFKKIVFNHKKLDKKFIYPFIVLFAVTILFFCVNFKVENWKTIVHLVVPIALSIEIYFLREEFKLDKIFKHGCYLLIIMCVLSLIYVLLKVSVNVFYIDAKGVYRFRGLTGHENSLATFVIMFMSFYLLLFFKKKIGPVEFYMVQAILILLGFSTKSKMFLVLLALLLIIYFAKIFKQNWKNALIQLAVLLIFGGILGVIFRNKVVELVNRFTDYFSERGFLNMITTGRADIWRHYISLWVATPLTILFGIGGSYQDAVINYSHNQYIEILSKYGIIGFMLVFSLIIYYVVTLGKDKILNLENETPLVVIMLICLIGLLDSGIAGVFLLSLSILSLHYTNNSTVSDGNIPKIVHYIWFGKKEIPEKTKEFIEGWRCKLPDYKFMLWNEQNFDIDSAPEFVKEAYEKKKYAFVSDYVRLYALYEYGGIYLDTDVEVVKSFDELLNNEFFIGREDAVYLSTSVIGAEKKNEIIEELLKIYKNRKFIKENGEFNLTTNVEIISKFLKNIYDYDFVNSEQHFKGCTIYKRESFSSKNYLTKKIIKSDDKFSVHHFDGSWENQTNSKIKKISVSFLKKLPTNFSNIVIDEYKKVRFFIKK